MKKTFVTPTLQIISLQEQDILTLSIGKKPGDNDVVVDLDKLSSI